MSFLSGVFNRESPNPALAEMQEKAARIDQTTGTGSTGTTEVPAPVVLPAEAQPVPVEAPVAAPTIENPDTAPKAIPQVSGTPISEAEAEPAPVTEEPGITPEPQSSLTTEQPSITSGPTPLSQEPVNPAEPQVPPSTTEALPTPALEESPVAVEASTDTSPVAPEAPAQIVQPEAPFEPSAPAEEPAKPEVADNKQALLDEALTNLQDIAERQKQEQAALETKLAELQTQHSATEALIEKIKGTAKPESSAPEVPEETPVVESTDTSSNTL